MTEEGKPFGPERYKDIAKERYIISKHTHTSYEDTESISPTERAYILEFITEDLQKERDMYERARQEHNVKR